MLRQAVWTVAVFWAIAAIAALGHAQAPERAEKLPAPLRQGMPLEPPPVDAAPLVETSPPPRPAGGYLRGGLLLWQVQHGPAPILLTTAPNNGLNATGLTGGTIGAPGTTTLFDGSNLDYGTFGGVRLAAGVNFGVEGFWSLEAVGLFLPHRSIDYSSSGVSGGTPLLTIPFLDAATGQQAALDVNAQDANFNPFLTGGVAIHSDLQLWGAELNAIAHSIRTPERCVDVFAGLRTLNLTENLSMTQLITPTLDGDLTLQFPTVGQGAANYAAVVGGSRVQIVDSFSTRNQFFGPQVGGRFRWDFGSFSAELTGKVAFGLTHQRVAISGSSSAAAAIDPNTGAVVNNLTTPGGVFALQNNIGNHQQNPFTVVPEVGASVAWSPTPWLTLRLGYDVLYWSNVARPGAQIDPVLNSKLVPTGALLPTNTVPIGAFVSGAEQGRPYFAFQNTAFWAQGLQLGLTIQY